MARKTGSQDAPHAHEWDEAGNCSCGVHDPLQRAVPVSVDAPPAEDHSALLKELVDMHDLEQRLAPMGGGAPYADVRKVRREAEGLWRRARVAIYGEPEVDNKPRSKAEGERWKRNEERVAARRAGTQE